MEKERRREEKDRYWNECWYTEKIEKGGMMGIERRRGKEASEKRNAKEWEEGLGGGKGKWTSDDKAQRGSKGT